VTTLRTEALLLRAVDFGESDRIVHLLTPETGRLTAIAKGARRSRKRFAGTLDLFNHLRVQVDRRRPGAMAHLDEARLVQSFLGLRAAPGRFALACYLLEMLDRLAPEGGARTDLRGLFAFALSALAALEGQEPDARLRTFLELRGLEALGLRPELRRCVRCGFDVGGQAGQGEARGPAGGFRVGFHVADGGPVCRGCAEPADALLPVHVGTLRVLERSLGFDLGRLERLVLAGPALHEARALLSRFVRFHVGLELRSQRFLDARLTPAGAAGTLVPSDAPRRP
jgi:DNA repair protein RecO (recombination protein O)